MSRRAPYVIGPDGELFVTLRASGISPLCVFTDGITLTIDGKDTLIRLPDAIAWHEREAAAGDDMSRRAAEAMIQAREKIMAGRTAQDGGQ